MDGGPGADTMIGGAGNDTYLVDASDDLMSENFGEGIDTIVSSVTYALGANIENLTLVGNAALTGTGNALDNVIIGNSAANMLIGGTGNDLYVIGVGDTVVEQVDEGIDTVQTDGTFTLDGNIENLTLIGGAAINGSGNMLDNVLQGNSGNNILDGMAGADTMIGQAGMTHTLWIASVTRSLNLSMKASIRCVAASPTRSVPMSNTSP